MFNNENSDISKIIKYEDELNTANAGLPYNYICMNLLRLHLALLKNPELFQYIINIKCDVNEDAFVTKVYKSKDKRTKAIIARSNLLADTVCIEKPTSDRSQRKIFFLHNNFVSINLGALAYFLENMSVYYEPILKKDKDLRIEKNKSELYEALQNAQNNLNNFYELNKLNCMATSQVPEIIEVSFTRLDKQKNKEALNWFEPYDRYRIDSYKDKALELFIEYKKIKEMDHEEIEYNHKKKKSSRWSFNKTKHQRR